MTRHKIVALDGGIALLVAFTVLAFMGCRTIAPPSPILQVSTHLPADFFMLHFDAYGSSTDHLESERIASVLATKPIHRIVLLSYGWNNDPREAQGTYLRTLERYSETFDVSWDGILVIGIAWESGAGGVQRALGDILPFPALAEGVGSLSDQLTLPFTFWSKAALADRVGYLGLRTELNRIFSAVYPTVYLEIADEDGAALYRGPRTSCEERGSAGGFYDEIVRAIQKQTQLVPKLKSVPPTLVNSDGDKEALCLMGKTDPHIPQIYMIGHSFGSRVLSGIANENLGQFAPPLNPFVGRSAIRGAIFFQPALNILNIDPLAHYPTVVTMSRHDHANRFMYPIANAVLSSYTFTGLQAGLNGLPVLWQSLRPGSGNRGGETSRRWYAPLIDVMAIPLTIAWSVATLPIDYSYEQAKGATVAPGIGTQVLDTTANLPVLEIPTQLAASALGKDWGLSRKGLLGLGGQRESIGGAQAIPIGGSRKTTVSIASWLETGDGIETSGLTVIDASSVVKQGAFGNLENPLVADSVGWFDPIGAHSDFLHPEALALVDCVIRSTAANPTNHLADRTCAKSREIALTSRVHDADRSRVLEVAK